MIDVEEIFLVRSFLKKTIAQSLFSYFEKTYLNLQSFEDFKIDPVDNHAYKQLQDLISDDGILFKLIGAELDIANQLESKRLKGGRRSIPIPKQ